MPGESGVIVAHYNTGSHTGSFAKNITVKSNSVKDGTLKLVLRGKVYAEIEVKNNTLFFYDLIPGRKADFSVPVVNNMKTPLEIKGFDIVYPQNASAYFNVDVKLVKGSNGKQYLKFSVLPKKTAYQFKHSTMSVKVKTNSKQVPFLTFYLRLKIKKVVEINPTAVFMYSKMEGKTAPTTIEIETQMDSLEVKSVECNGCPLKFKVINISPKTKNILIEPDYSKGRKGFFNGVIKMKIKAGDSEKEYSVPIRGKIY